jgi:hypothetical protein
VRIAFSVEGMPCEFHRDPFIGGTQLRCGYNLIELQRVSDPLTHLSLKLLRTWELHLGPHLVHIERRRPLLFAGFRPHGYRVFVDGQLVAERHGF